MEKKSYPEILHNICVEFGHGEKSRVEQFEKAIVLIIDQIVTDEKKKLLPNENPPKSEHYPKNEHYLKNEDIKSDCESCSRNDIIVGCTLKRKNKCLVNGKYTKYRRGYLLPCDRCKTYSVVTKVDMIPHNNSNNIPRPAIKFMCIRCKDYPMINKETFRGYELRGVEFTEKYLNMCKQKEQKVKSVEQEKTGDAKQVHIVQKAEFVHIEQGTESVQNTQHLDSTQDIQQTEPEIDVIAISAENGNM